MKIGEKISYYRKKLCLTQEQLATGICSVSYLSKIENGVVIPSDEIINLLAEKLQITLNLNTQENFEKVKELLEDWYRIILSRNQEEAIIYEKIINEHMNTIEDPSLHIQYSLFSLRYNLLLRDMNSSKALIKHLKSVQNNFSIEHSYYFNFFCGLFEYLDNNLLVSLEFFCKSEKLGKKINKDDPYLFYLISLVYSKLHHISLAIHYSNIALDKFNQNIDYIHIIDASTILVINYIRTEMYDKAEKKLFQLLKLSRKLNNEYLISNIYHNLGYLYSKISRSIL